MTRKELRTLTRNHVRFTCCASDLQTVQRNRKGDTRAYVALQLAAWAVMVYILCDLGLRALA